MEKRKIGSLDVSVVGLGCNNFGGRLDESATARVVHAALDAGVNFFDTADIYGGTRSEVFVGRALAGRRHEAVIATKFGMKVDEEKKGAKPDYVRRAAEDSLRRLNVEVIDLYQLHEPDPGTPIGDTLAAMDALVKEGKVREIGCSNFSADQLKEAEAAVQSGAARFVSVQNHYSLLHREPEKAVLAECAREGMAFLPFFPLAMGLLTGKYRKDAPHPEGTRIGEGSDWLTDENLDKVEKLIAFAEARDHTILDLAFSWLLAHPTVASVIAGATSPEQVRANVAAAGRRLTDADVSEISQLAPAD